MEELTHKSILATYDMYDVTDGRNELIESTTREQPLRFMTDFGMMPLTAFENKLKELSTGDNFELTLTPEEAFGVYVEERVVDVEKEIFSVNGEFDQVHVRPGVILPLQNEEGQRFMAQVVSISEDKVKIDLNHPLAGKSLLFKGTILESHYASQDEIMALLNQMNHHGCGGCGGGNCSGNCGEGSCDGNCSGHCGEGGCHKE